jgi:hypothetical protein
MNVAEMRIVNNMNSGTATADLILRRILRGIAVA